MSGLPPCRRCVEQQLECVLAKSRRGGRRIKGVRNSTIQPPSRDGDHHGTPSDGHGQGITTHDDDDSEHDSRPRSHSGPGNHPSGADDIPGWLSPPQQTGDWREDSPEEEETAHGMAGSRTSSDGLEGHIATTDLLNPSDALDLLAQVADLDPGRQRDASTGQVGANSRHVDGMQQPVGRLATSYYPPLNDGALTLSEAAYLVKR